MSSPNFDGVARFMTIRGLIFWGILGALGATGLTVLAEAEAPVMTLERTLGADVKTTRL